VTERAGLKVERFDNRSAWADYDRDGNVIYSSLAMFMWTSTICLSLAVTQHNAVIRVFWCSAGRAEMEGETTSYSTIAEMEHLKTFPKKAGVSDPNKRFGLGVVWGTMIMTAGRPLVANDAGPNYLYRTSMTVLSKRQPYLRSGT